MYFLTRFLKLTVFILIFSLLFCSCDEFSPDGVTQTDAPSTVTTVNTTTETATETSETTLPVITEASTSEPAVSESTPIYEDPSSAENDDYGDELNERLLHDFSLNPSQNFFDDAVFVGDSVTLGLKNRAVSQRNKGVDYLGTAQFLCAGSLNFYSAAADLSDPDAIHPTYKGQKVTVPDGIMLCGAEKVFIMLGMNDFSAFREVTWQKNIDAVLSSITKLSPNADIFIQSVTPVVSGYEHGSFNNRNIAKFNNYLKKICFERDLYYIDINTVLSDESGYLRTEYCGDLSGMGIHMSHTGADTWANYLEDTFCR